MALKIPLLKCLSTCSNATWPSLPIDFQIDIHPMPHFFFCPRRMIQFSVHLIHFVKLIPLSQMHLWLAHLRLSWTNCFVTCDLTVGKKKEFLHPIINSAKIELWGPKKRHELELVNRGTFVLALLKVHNRTSDWGGSESFKRNNTSAPGQDRKKGQWAQWIDNWRRNNKIDCSPRQRVGGHFAKAFVVSDNCLFFENKRPLDVS